MKVAVTQWPHGTASPRQSDAVHIVAIRSVASVTIPFGAVHTVHTVDCLLVIPQRKQNLPFLPGSLGPRAGPHFS